MRCRRSSVPNRPPGRRALHCKQSMAGGGQGQVEGRGATGMWRLHCHTVPSCPPQYSKKPHWARHPPGACAAAAPPLLHAAAVSSNQGGCTRGPDGPTTFHNCMDNVHTLWARNTARVPAVIPLRGNLVCITGGSYLLHICLLLLLLLFWYAHPPQMSPSDKKMRKCTDASNTTGSK